MKNSIKLLCLVLVSLVLLSGCRKKSSENKILSFKFASLEGVEVTITESPKRIVALVPFGTNLTSLVPIITISENATIRPASGIVTDFTEPVVYTVTAEDGSEAKYTAVVNINQNEDEGEDGDPTHLSGFIDNNRTLPDLGFKVDYVIDGTLRLTEYALLTVEPGVTIVFSDKDSGIEVGENAGLKMVGTANKPITLKGPLDQQSNGSWDRILIHSDRSENQFEYVRFLRGGQSDELWHGVVNVQDKGKLSMKHCLIDGSLNTGLTTEGSGYMTVFEDNVIRNCSLYPWATQNFQTLCSDIRYNNTLTGNVDNRVYVGAQNLELNDPMTLAALPIPYYFNEGFNFLGNKTITFQEGVTIEMPFGKNIWVGNDCAFIAKGTAEKPIVFRNGDSGTAWGGIIFSSTRSSNIMEHCQVIGCGDSDPWDHSCCLYIRSDAVLTLNNNSFGHSNFYGVGIESIVNWANVQHSGNTFTGCKQGNVFIEIGGNYNGNVYQDYSTVPSLP